MPSHYANGNRKAQQKAYNKTPKGKKLRVDANRANRKLGTYGNHDGNDAAHTAPNTAKLQSPSANRRNPRKGKKYSSGKGRKV